jgi:tRNA pseudouridine65 synthase
LTDSLVVLFEDEACFVVDKPSGLAAHRGLSREAETLVDRIAAARPGPVHLVHRLDRGTSGAVLVAKSAAAAAALGAELTAGRVEKTYLALVRGALSGELLVDHPVPRDEGGPRIDAVTRVRGLATVELADSPLRETRYSLVEARPLTGRFHQVRRHCKHLGHPLVGDTTYGRSEHNQLVRTRVGLARLALHASRRVRSPVGPFIDVVSPLPPDLTGPLSLLGLLDFVDVGC